MEKCKNLNREISSPLPHQVGTRLLMGLSPPGVSTFGFPQPTVLWLTGSIGQHHMSPGHSPMHQSPPSPSSKHDLCQNLSEKDRMRSHSLAQSDPSSASCLRLHDQSFRNSITSCHQNLQSGNVRTSPTPKLFPTMPSLHRARHVPSSEQPLLDEGSSSLMRDASLELPSSLVGDSQGQSNVSSLLAAVMKSGLLPGTSVSPEVESPAISPLASQLISISPPDARTSSGPRDSIPPFSQRKLQKPSLPRGPPSAASSPTSSSSAQTFNVANANSNPISSLFSTLLAKGLISDNQSQEESADNSTKTAVEAPHVPKTSTDKLSSPEPSGKRCDASAQSTKDESENLIGFEFWPPLLWQLHPAVMKSLRDNLPHRCTSCGLRFRLLERLHRHSEWHAFRNPAPNSLNKLSRRWYSNSADWIAGKAGFPFSYDSMSFLEESSKTVEENEKMVPADEIHCVCFLYVFFAVSFLRISTVKKVVNGCSKGRFTCVSHLEAMTDDIAVRAACRIGLHMPTV